MNPCCRCRPCRMSPAFEFSSDGTSLDPLEVMFVKVKSYMLESELTFSKKAAKIHQWQQQVGGGLLLVGDDSGEWPWIHACGRYGSTDRCQHRLHRWLLHGMSWRPHKADSTPLWAVCPMT